MSGDMGASDSTRRTGCLELARRLAGGGILDFGFGLTCAVAGWAKPQATDFGWRVKPWLQPTVRASWQGRSADHTGVGGGLGLVFDW